MDFVKNQTADQAWVRRMNRAVILEVFRTQKTLSRALQAIETGIKTSTDTHIISELIQVNLLRETDLARGSLTGRPGSLLELNPGGGCAMGIEINVDYYEVLVTDFAANVLWQQRQSYQPGGDPESILVEPLALARRAAVVIEERKSRLLGLGVGVPGVVDVSSGILRFAPNLHCENVPIRDIFAQYFDCPIYVENEANAAALGEYYFGTARHEKNFIYLSAGVGLGSGIVIGGKLFRGMSGYAGEAGHMTLDPDGDLCGCGKRGCWETFSSPRAVEQRVRRVLASGAESLLNDLVNGEIRNIVFDDVLRAAEKGDCVAIDALNQVALYMGKGIANLVNLFDVEVFVLGGALNKASSFIMQNLELVALQETLSPGREHIRIIPSAHGCEACVMGAIALVLDDVLRESAFYQ